MKWKFVVFDFICLLTERIKYFQESTIVINLINYMDSNIYKTSNIKDAYKFDKVLGEYVFR